MAGLLGLPISTWAVLSWFLVHAKGSLVLKCGPGGSGSRFIQRLDRLGTCRDM